VLLPHLRGPTCDLPNQFELVVDVGVKRAGAAGAVGEVEEDGRVFLPGKEDLALEAGGDARALGPVEGGGVALLEHAPQANAVESNQFAMMPRSVSDDPEAEPTISL